MSRLSRKIIEQRKLRLLGILLEYGKRLGEKAEVSYSQLSSDMQFSDSGGAVRRLVKGMEEEGLITVQARFLPNGGQLENAYRITEKGMCLLQKVEIVDKDGGES